jgi:CubicO group peptidase (beta-lactamase class C family)
MTAVEGTSIEGVCAPRFGAVTDAFAANLAERGDLGARVCVIHRGEVVVDQWGGWADRARTRPWTEVTLTNMWSSTKGVVALAAQMLVDRGQLDLDAPVATYWPEFAAAGKDALPVRYLLSHRAGLCGFREQVTIDDLPDWERLAELLAGMEPWWEPGTVSGYHALTYGWLVGEVIRRVDGRSVGRFVAEEIARPLGADLHIGLGEAEMARCAEMAMDPLPPDADMAAMFAQLTPAVIAALTNPSMAAPFAADIANQPDWRAAEIPAANGHGTGRSLATVYAALANAGELHGVRLLSPEGAERIREGQGRGVDLLLGVGMAGVPMEFALGVILGGPEHQYGPNPRAFGHDGYGGSFGMADPEAGLAIGWVMNKMGSTLAGDPRKVAIIDAVYSSLG